MNHPQIGKVAPPVFGRAAGMRVVALLVGTGSAATRNGITLVGAAVEIAVGRAAVAVVTGAVVVGQRVGTSGRVGGMAVGDASVGGRTGGFGSVVGVGSLGVSVGGVVLVGGMVVG